MKKPFRLEVLALLPLTLPAAAPRQARKLNPTLAQPVAGRVTESAFTPDGSLAVYRADQDLDERYELYSVPADGSAPPIAISGALASGRDVEPGFSIRADGTRVVYRSDQATDDVVELFSAPTDASAAPARLNATLVDGGRVEADFALAPDGDWVVYRANQEQDVIEIYSAPVAGGASPVKLNGPLLENEEVYGFQISPDGAWVVFVAGGLFRAPIDGSVPPIQLSAGWVTEFLITPAADRVVFLMQSGFAEAELYSVPLDASASPTKLSGPYVPNQSVSGLDSCDGTRGAAFRVSPDGSQVVFRSNRDVSYVLELYGVPIDGSASPTKLLPAGWSSVVPNFQISPDGARVVFQLSCGGTPGLGSVPIDGSAAPVTIYGTSRRSVQRDFVLVGEQAVFRAPAIDFGAQELFSAPIDASLPALRLNAALPPGAAAGVASFRVSLDGTRVAYAAEQATPTLFELFSAPLDASAAPIRLNLPFAPFADVESVPASLAISLDSSRVLFRADTDFDQVIELHGAPLAASGGAVKLNDPFPPGPTLGDVEDARIAPGGTHVVYRADQVTDELTELYSVAMDGAFTVTRLGPVDPDREVESFLISPDGTRVAFREGADLYTVPIDGSAGAVQLDTTSSTDTGRLTFYDISPDSAWIVFAADLDFPYDYQLYAAPIDGSAARVQLNGDLTPGGDVAESTADFRISPDGTRVVYRADEKLDGRFELFSVPIDGSESPRKLNAPLPSGGDVTVFFEISPDGTRVAYRADQVTNESFELFSVPIDDSAPPVRLNGPLVALGNVVSAFRISPDSSRVVYRADQATNDVFELYSAPLDGSAAAIQLSGTPPFWYDVVQPSFLVSADSARAVYLHGTALFSVPLDGSASPVRLDPGGADRVVDFLIGAERVVFRTHRDSSTSYLFSAPIGAGAAAIQLSASDLPYLSYISDFRLTPGGREALYAGNQTFPDRVDLYRVRLDGRSGPEQLSHSVSRASTPPVFDVSSNDAYCIYVRPEDTADVCELYLQLRTAGRPRAEPDAPTGMVERPGG